MLKRANTPVRQQYVLKVFFILFFTATIITSCRQDPEVLEPVAESYEFKIPAGFPQPVYNFENNKVTEAGFKLGRKLFYDPVLSRDNTVACASCHQQVSAFAHTEHRISHGINDLLGTRNAPSIFNTAWYSSFMWDGGINHIELQPAGPIANPVEMDESLPNVIAKLSALSQYRDMFREAFGSDTITSQRMFRAMAQFMGMMVSSDSKYDKFLRGETTLSATENNGLTLFNAKCSNCHSGVLLTDFQFRNNGLAVDPAVNDSGRAHITGNPSDLHKFKTPTLRNIELTGPYMHDGRFATLEQTLDHYTSGIVNSATLEPQLTGGIPMTAQEKADIIVFLKTLTDRTFTSDHRFSEHAVFHEH